MAAILAALIAASSENGQAQTRIWKGGDGVWSDAAHWEGGVPTASNDARFQLDANSPEAELNVAVSGSRKVRAIQVMPGKEVTLSLAAGSTLDLSGGLTRVGYAPAEGTHLPGGPSTLIFAGVAGEESAKILLGETQVGASGAAAAGNSLVFTGNVFAEDHANKWFVVGRFANDNTMQVLNGASVVAQGFRVGTYNASTGGSQTGNSVEVSGAGSRLEVRNEAVQIGVGNGLHGNRISARAGGRVQIRNGKALNIGAASSFGNNALTVGAGGEVSASGKTTIAAHALDGGVDRGHNRLVIEAGGVFAAGDAINNLGLVQLEAGGELKGEGENGVAKAITLTTSAGARFEAEGSGLASNVALEFESGGRFVIGVEEGTEAELALDSLATFADGSTLEMRLFGNGMSDRITLGENASILLNGVVTLALDFDPAYLPSAGDAWTLFDGELAALAGSFDLSGLDETLFNTTLFNAEGGWKLSAIPEPGSIALLVVAAAGAIGVGWRKRA